MTTPAPFVAPPSVVGNAVSKLAPGLVQAQTDITSLTNLLTNWPISVDPSLRQVVEIQQRIIQYLGIIGKACAVLAKDAELVQ